MVPRLKSSRYGHQEKNNICASLACLAQVVIALRIEASTSTFNVYQPRRVSPVPLYTRRRDPLFRRLLLGNLLGLFLLLLQEVADPLEDVAGQNKAGGDDCFATSHNALAAALLVFIAVGLECPVFGVVCGVERPVDVCNQCILNLFCLGLDNRDALVKFAQELVTQLICLGHIGLRVGCGGLEVGQGRLDKFCVASIGEINGSGAVRVLFDRLDRIGHQRIGLKVLYIAGGSVTVLSRRSLGL